jgi:signal transduction histidine kinase
MPSGPFATYSLAVRLRLDPQRVDIGVAALLTVTAQIQLAVLAPSAGQWLANGVLWALVTALPAVRRHYPALVGIGVQAAQVTQHSLSLDAGTASGPPALAVAWFMALYALAVWSSTRMFVLGAVFFAVTNFAPFTHLEHELFHDVTLAFTVVALIVMVLLRRIVGDRERRAQVAERERDVAAREAVLDERGRIARELHDAIAHNVSMMVLQAGAERRVLDPEIGATREVLEGIERSGRSALTEMRRLVGMLRTDTADPLTPQPGLADVPTLITQVREAGMPVELRIEGDPREVPVGVGLSAYRIVQEALTNVLKHADQAHATVRVRYAADSLELEIVDDGFGRPAAVAGGGHGLVGMRERVALYGGRFSADHVPDGGFAVRVLLPVR